MHTLYVPLTNAYLLFARTQRHTNAKWKIFDEGPGMLFYKGEGRVISG